jgi:hypothetical protein
MPASAKDYLRPARRHPWITGAVLLLVAVILLLDRLVDEPARKWLENAANEKMIGYTVRLPEADLRPWNLALHFSGFTVSQVSHPEPAVASIRHGTFSIEWRSLLRGHLVADLRVDEPAIHVESTQLRAEDDDDVSLKDKGWQHLLEVYPLKINRAVVTGGSLNYRDQESGRTLALDHIEFSARNIRHVAADDVRYPSPFKLSASVFDKGQLQVKGQADFLLRPFVGVYALIELTDAPLGAFGPVVDDYRLKLEGGILALKGQIELRPDTYIANLQKLVVDDLKLDLLGGKPTPQSARAAKGVADAAKTVNTDPDIRVRLQDLRIRGDLGYVMLADPAFRVYLKDGDLQVSNWSNRAWQGDTQIILSGLFMGSGRTRVQGVMHPGEGPADFAIDARIINTELTALNELLQHYGRLDVGKGKFSLYTQMYARDGELSGYVKPLFDDVEILTPEDEDDSPLHKLYEFVAEKVAALLENKPRDEVSTVADLNGDLSDPDVSVWQVVGNLLRNAFIEAILPGFDRERAREVREK